ncbi:MAG: ribosome biogenesis factor YjgA [Desulfocapsaceae bacterium]|nr:ribosome biogenesis factor YjgA [Desulfocapsaceae bacterium]
MTEILSRSEQKRAFKRIEDAAAELADLSNNDLKKFPGGQEIVDEILVCRTLKGGARNRQIKYLAKVMRQAPLDEIYTFLTDIKGSDLRHKEVFHEAERLRDTMINEAMEDHQRSLRLQVPWEPVWESDIIDHAVGKYPSLNPGEIRKSIFQYVKSRNIVHYRELFRMLKSAIDYEETRKKAL